MDKETNDFIDRAFLIGLEYGYKQCELGYSITMAVLNGEKFVKTVPPKQTKESNHGRK